MSRIWQSAWRRLGLVVVGVVLAFAGVEAAVRLAGAVDFPVYRADRTLGYIPAPSQSGSFLNKNTWRFNSLSMGAAEFVPSPAAQDVLLVGDSVVLGGNPYREPDRLGPQLAKATGAMVWPISAGSWALQNELTWLKQHAEVVRQVDALVFVLNSGDFGEPSSWACDLTHPLQAPKIAALYLLRKYGGASCPPVQPEMHVPTRDWQLDLKAFLATPEVAGKPVVFYLYPDKSEMTDAAKRASLGARAQEIRALGGEHVYEVAADDRWNTSFYKDGIHPVEAGTAVLASILASHLPRAAAR